MDDLDDIEGANDDHCYVVNSSGHVSKRLRLEPLSVCSSTGGIAGNPQISGSSSSRSRHLIQQPDVLEQILEQLVRVHRDTLALHERHNTRIEKLIKENAIQTKRLADVLGQLLNNSRMEDCGNKHDKNSSDIE